jgi:arylsulfatase A-like enzyme
MLVILFLFEVSAMIKYLQKQIHIADDPHQAPSSSRPNIVFIVADDLGYSSIGYESYDLEGYAPFLTSLLKQGINLENYYTQETCTPSRAALMTGKYPIHLGMQYEVVQPQYNWGLSIKETLLPEILRDFGNYTNYGIGKWHLGHASPNMLPTARGFHHWFGYNTGEVYYWSKQVPQFVSTKDLLYMDETCYSPYNDTDSNDYSTFLFRDKAISVIEQYDFMKNPLFLYLAFQAVHTPYLDIDSYLTGVPPSYFPANSTLYQDMSIRLNSSSNRFHYGLSLALMDLAIESIVTALITMNQMNNTMIIFVSDNGGCTLSGGRNGPLRGAKGTMFEGK